MLTSLNGKNFIQVLRHGFDLLLPSSCMTCQKPIGSDHALCVSCWQQLTFLEKPWCARLGTPFAYDLGPEALSAQAIANPPVFNRLRSAVSHDDIARKLVHRFKYGDQTELAELMARWMIRAGQELLQEGAIVIPIPLHRWRLWQRRYNQSSLLALHIGAITGHDVLMEGLVRHKKTKQQVGLNARQREQNLSGAFTVPASVRPLIKDRAIVLIDDVYTTGATVHAATRALLRHKVQSVDVLTFSRAMADCLQ
jgi:ComF family protein